MEPLGRAELTWSLNNDPFDTLTYLLYPPASFNSPTHPLTQPIPLSSFQSVRISFSAQWRYRYDQAGLLLHFTQPGSSSTSSTLPQSASGFADKWFKGGVEVYMGRRYIASVACDTYADWALTPPADSSSSHEDSWTTIELRREGDELGTSLWFYQLILAEDRETVKERIPLREVCWVFDLETSVNDEAWQVQVSAMVARPAPQEQVDPGESELKVEFRGAKVETK